MFRLMYGRKFLRGDAQPGLEFEVLHLLALQRFEMLLMLFVDAARRGFETLPETGAAHAFIIQPAGRFIVDQDCLPCTQSTRNGDPLLLPAGQRQRMDNNER